MQKWILFFELTQNNALELSNYPSVIKSAFEGYQTEIAAEGSIKSLRVT